MLDGNPIFAALTGIERPSSNTKTGPMAQIWIMRSDINPMEATNTNADASVCGTCPLKGSHGKDRSCYVTLFQAPNNIFKTKANLRHPPNNIFRNRAVRLGAYGDMAALPVAITARIVKHAALTTGYTHQWRTCDQTLSNYLMASCDSEADRELAKSMGWNTFRVKAPEQVKLKGETFCPASEEGGKIMTCYTCGRCNGSATKDVVINVHGTGKNQFHKLSKEPL
jgi:hypothetical protein